MVAMEKCSGLLSSQHTFWAALDRFFAVIDTGPLSLGQVQEECILVVNDQMSGHC